MTDDAEMISVNEDDRLGHSLARGRLKILRPLQQRDDDAYGLYGLDGASGSSASVKGTAQCEAIIRRRRGHPGEMAREVLD